MKIYFKNYLESSEEKEEKESLRKTLSLIPKKHKELLDNYKIKLLDRVTIDGKNVGLMCGKNITISNSWNYGKEFIILHEIGHVVWQEILSPKDKKDWKSILDKTKDEQKEKTKSTSLNQNEEEIFCMAYASKYAKHPSNVYHNKEWLKFIEKFN